jgi:hypothetical protein
VTCNHQHLENDGHNDDHVHPTRSQQEVMLTDFFHIIHYTGMLLNKKAPNDDST